MLALLQIRKKKQSHNDSIPQNFYRKHKPYSIIFLANVPRQGDSVGIDVFFRFPPRRVFAAMLGFCPWNCGMMNSCSFAKFGFLPWQDMAGSGIQARIFRFLCVALAFIKMDVKTTQSGRLWTCGSANDWLMACGKVTKMMGSSFHI